MTLLIAYVLFALLVSFLCSIMEAVLLSITPSFVAQLEQEEHPVGKHVRKLKSDIDRPLAAILSLNTIANTAGATGAGAQAAIVFGDAIIGVFSAILTFMILVFSEIIPKTLGALYWRQLTPFVVRVLRTSMVLMWPLVQLSKGITRMLTGSRPRVDFSREEFNALAQLGKETGIIEEQESRILGNLLKFASICVKDIMTPRTVVFALAEQTTVMEVMEKQADFQFSRIPVFEERRDDISGYVLKDEILLKAAQDEDDTILKDLKRAITAVPESMSLSLLFERMLDEKDHIALVVDEYGGFAGIVSMEDVVETLLGMEIIDEEDNVQDMQELARQQWRKRAARLGIITELDEEPLNKASR